MGRTNDFRHQEYSSDVPFAKFELLSPDLPPPPGTTEYADRLAAVGNRFAKLGVTTIGLMHGTFVGNDALGLVREIGRLAPGLSQRLHQSGKQISDKLAGESGNFTTEFADSFAEHLNRDIENAIDVHTFDWSSENNHTGRADGAIRLIDGLLETRKSSADRIVLLGHSHAANVFAIATNLLATCEAVREQFFDATRSFYQTDSTDVVDVPVWDRVRNRLNHISPESWNLDIITFGAPVRYGWETSCINSLTHFIHHRPAENMPILRAPFPPRVDDIVRCRHGDFVQQVAIAGTDFLPYMLSRRTRLAERKLSRLLQPGIRRRQIFDRLKHGQRIHDAGMNLLVEYADDPNSLPTMLLGHGIYTRREWLVFHAEQIANRLPPNS